MAGRKKKLTHDMIEKVYEYTREGHYANTVAELCGISEQTYYTYYNKGEALYNTLEEDTETTPINEDDILYLEFFESIKRANAEAEQEALSRIKKAGKRNWQANAWFLERRFAQRWRQKQETDVTLTATQETAEKVSTIFSKFTSANEAGKE